MSYYKDQLKQIEVQENFSPTFQFKNALDGRGTKWMNLNKESINDLREFLDNIESSLI